MPVGLPVRHTAPLAYPTTDRSYRQQKPSCGRSPVGARLDDSGMRHWMTAVARLGRHHSYMFSPRPGLLHRREAVAQTSTALDFLCDCYNVAILSEPFGCGCAALAA
jgi:hypothetical protein